MSIVLAAGQHGPGDARQLISDRHYNLVVWSPNADAVAAEERLRQKPGFVDTPEGFEIHEYQLKQDHWTEGYVCV
jgi:hypothetical protein